LCSLTESAGLIELAEKIGGYAETRPIHRQPSLRAEEHSL
jgi:hypothetical protein